MYLFTRRTQLASADGLEWADAVGARAAEVGGLPVDLWGKMYGDDFGTVTWSVAVPDLATLETFGDTINADPGYQETAARGAELTIGGVHDGLLQPIVGEPDPAREPRWLSAVSAVCAGGQIERAMGLGAEIAGKASAVTGHNTLFVRAMTGPYGGVGWLTGYPDVAALEKAQDALAADAGWLGLIDSTGGAFAEEPTITVATLHRKVN